MTHNSFKMFEVDHVVPRSRGGTDHKSNLQLLCSPCNRIGGDRPMEYPMAREVVEQAAGDRLALLDRQAA